MSCHPRHSMFPWKAGGQKSIRCRAKKKKKISSPLNAPPGSSRKKILKYVLWQRSALIPKDKKNKIRNQDYCSSQGHVALPRDFVANICFLWSKVTTVKLANSAKRGKSRFTWEACLSNQLGPVRVVCIAQLVPLRTSWAHPPSMVPATLSRLRVRGNFQKH